MAQEFGGRQGLSMSCEERERRSIAEAAIGGFTAEDVTNSMEMIREYMVPYQELFWRREQSEHFGEVVVGLTSRLERKSVEPIAVLQGLPRYTLQHFVGGSLWSWAPLMDRLREEVGEEIGIAAGSIVLDGSATPKKGTETVGVKRQWCGHLGKTDNCVVGVYAAYVGKGDAAALVAADLFLPEEWVDDEARRRKAFVPGDVTYRTQPTIAMDMLRELDGKLPFQWVMADDEFGRTRALRDLTHALGKSYIVDVPRNTVMRRIRGDGVLAHKKWQANRLVRKLPVAMWHHFHVRDGEKGPHRVRAAMVPVATERDDKSWVPETLVVIETLNGSQRWYCLARVPPGTPPEELVRQASLRHRVEDVFKEAKGEVGLDHFETRSWQGWYHHMTLCLIAHWFLLREKRRWGKRGTGPHSQHDAHGHRRPPLPAFPHPQRRAGQLSPPPQ